MNPGNNSKEEKLKDKNAFGNLKSDYFLQKLFDNVERKNNSKF